MPYEFRVTNRHADDQKGGRMLSLIWRGENGEVAQATGIEFKHLHHGVLEDRPMMTDAFGNDVEEFLQGALDAAWAMGLKPKAFESMMPVGAPGEGYITREAYERLLDTHVTGLMDVVEKVLGFKAKIGVPT